MVWLSLAQIGILSGAYTVQIAVAGLLFHRQYMLEDIVTSATGHSRIVYLLFAAGFIAVVFTHGTLDFMTSLPSPSYLVIFSLFLALLGSLAHSPFTADETINFYWLFTGFILLSIAFVLGSRSVKS